MEKELIKMKERVAELKAWKDAITVERLTFPLDAESRNTINLNSLLFTGFTRPPVTNITSDIVIRGMEVTINGKNRILWSSEPINPYLPNSVANILTSINGPHNLSNGEVIYVITDDTLPAGLFDSVGYYVINRTNTTFQVSLTSGGAAVDFSDIGIGNQYFTKLTVF